MTLRFPPIALLAVAGLAGTASADMKPLFGGAWTPLAVDYQFVAPVASPSSNARNPACARRRAKR